ncbi:MAG: CPBP family intramembrane metalloprotease [Sphingopyxis sp.]|jgi:hypothetical protein|nr:CPBP family intramembrane metalloprotease [Sphingopyxis sp.]
MSGEVGIAVGQSPVVGVLGKIRRHPLFLLIVGFVAIILSLIIAGLLSDITGDTARTWMAQGRNGQASAMLQFGQAMIGILALLFYWLFVRYVERAPFRDFAGPGKFSEWAYGVVIGAGVMALTIAAIAAFGGYRVVGTNSPAVLLALIGVTIQAGVMEEILLRGVFFRFLEQWLGSWVALAASAALFGFLHIANPNASLLAAVAIALEAGILLGAIYMLTRRLWAAIGLHMAWNFVQGGIFGVNVSGFDSVGVLVPRMAGDPLLTGGAFGAEASLPAIILCTSLGVYFLWRAHRAGRFVRPSWHRFKTGEDAPR